METQGSPEVCSPGRMVNSAAKGSCFRQGGKTVGIISKGSCLTFTWTLWYACACRCVYINMHTHICTHAFMCTSRGITVINWLQQCMHTHISGGGTMTFDMVCTCTQAHLHVFPTTIMVI